MSSNAPVAFQLFLAFRPKPRHPLLIPRLLSTSACKQSPAPAVSTALFRQAPLSVLLVKRANPPNQHLWSLPGGRLHRDEALFDAALRELHEETSIPLNHASLLPNPILSVLVPEHRPVYRISVFAGVYTGEKPPLAADDAADARFCRIADLSRLPTVPNLGTTIRAALHQIQTVDFRP